MIQTEQTPNPNSLKFLSDFIISSVGTEEFQKKEIEKAKSNENALIPDQLSYQDIKGLSNESRQKLLEVKPRTIAHAQRIPGITPATISLLLVHLKRTQNWKSANVSKKSV